MPDLYDYMKWRGDLSLEQDGLNDIDCLILSRISYLPFDGLVPQPFGESVSLAEAAELLVRKGDGCHYIMQADRRLLPAAAACRRFASMRLCGFVNQLDIETQKQFSALVVELGEGNRFISYRGTDDTMIGWKEDFNMSFMREVPSQLAALAYLHEAAEALEGNFLLGGHSKGGNLAVYAAACCAMPVQERVLRVYNFDGPGFHAEVLAQEGFKAIKGKVFTCLPQSSVVGMLLEHEESYHIIQSSQSGFMQHDLYSWDVLGTGFITLDTVTNGSRFLDHTIKAWLAEMDEGQRETFIEGLYSIVKATNSSNLQEFTAKSWYDHALAVLRAIINLDGQLRMVLAKTLLALVMQAKNNLHIYRGLEKKLEEAAADEPPEE